MSTATPPASLVGVFGKLPGLGDFLARGLDARFTDAWHAWLTRELPSARTALGDEFDAAYLQAPAWRYGLAPGLAGPAAMTGVVIPSVDAVGRLFPLTLAAEGGAAETAGWYDALEDLARAVLEEAWLLEPWLAAVAALPGPRGTAGPAEGGTFWGEGSPLVAAGGLRFPALPAGENFLRLLRDRPTEAAAA